VAQRAAFWATATHDLCQPAQALALFLDRLRRQLPPGAPTDVQGYLDSSMRDLSRLLEGLMEVAQIDAGEIQAASEPVSVAGVLRRVQDQLNPMAKAQGVRLEVRSHAFTVETDAALLERVLMALAHNAVGFSAKGTVLLSAQRVQGGSQVRIAVSDSGPGIAERDHSKIFEPFGQRRSLDPSAAPRPSLGLYLASRNAALLGSSLQLRSALGRGSRFSLSLPLMPSIEPPLSMAGTPAGHAELGGLCVLLHDSQAERAQAMAALLQSWECAVMREPLVGSGSGLVPTAIAVAWDPHAPEGALAWIAQMRGRYGADLPVCLIHVTANADLSLFTELTGVVALSDPVQPGQLRAWLRRSVRR